MPSIGASRGLKSENKRTRMGQKNQAQWISVDQRIVMGTRYNHQTFRRCHVGVWKWWIPRGYPDEKIEISCSDSRMETVPVQCIYIVYVWIKASSSWCSSLRMQIWPVWGVQSVWNPVFGSMQLPSRFAHELSEPSPGIPSDSALEQGRCHRTFK